MFLMPDEEGWELDLSEIISREDKEVIELIEEQTDKPKNNDGLKYCAWCGAPTKKEPITPSKIFDVCTNKNCTHR